MAKNLAPGALQSYYAKCRTPQRVISQIKREQNRWMLGCCFIPWSDLGYWAFSFAWVMLPMQMQSVTKGCCSAVQCKNWADTSFQEMKIEVPSLGKREWILNRGRNMEKRKEILISGEQGCIFPLKIRGGKSPEL